MKEYQEIINFLQSLSRVQPVDVAFILKENGITFVWQTGPSLLGKERGEVGRKLSPEQILSQIPYSEKYFIKSENGFAQCIIPLKVGEELKGAILSCGDNEENLKLTAPLIAETISTLLRQHYEIDSLTAEISSRYEELSLLYEMGESFYSMVEIEKRSLHFLEIALTAVGAERGNLILYKERKPLSFIFVHSGYENSLKEELISIRERAKEVCLKGRPALDEKSFLIVPLKIQDRTIGAIGVEKKKGNLSFTAGDLKLLTTIASQIAMFLENVRLYENLEQLLLNTIKSLVAAIDAKDPNTKGHSERVVRYVLGIADALRLSEMERKKLELAALLHDVGKIGLPDVILENVGTLSRQKWRRVKQHPQMGVRILSHVSALKELLPVIRSHHERYDGKGYPDGIKGNKIPLFARIIAVADAYDAMTASRTYRVRFGSKEAKEELLEYAGKQFDPQIVKAFIRVLGNVKK
ncbi:MAG: HD-GYP domain-containing protein [Candidatus Edwardsbacteria bacterium]